MKKYLLILLLIPFHVNAQLTITYLTKCDKLKFTNGINHSDTTYNIIIDSDSIKRLDYEYTIDSVFHINAEDLTTNGLEVTVNIDSLTAMPSYFVPLSETYYHNYYSIDRHLHLDSIMKIKGEDLDTVRYITTACDTSYFTILQSCDTCTNKNIDCYNTYSNGAWHNECIDKGWTVIANRELLPSYTLSLRNTPYTVMLYVEAQNLRNIGSKQWQYIYIVPKKQAVLFERKLVCKNYKIFYTFTHMIYSTSCSLKDI